MFRRLTRPDCLAFISPTGMVFGRLGERQKRSSKNSMRPWSLPWPSRQSVSDLPSSDRRFSRVSNKRRTRLVSCRKPRLRNGGRSSRKQASSRKDELILLEQSVNSFLDRRSHAHLRRGRRDAQGTGI